MTLDQWIVLVTAVLAMAAFASEKVAPEIIALCVLVALAATGVVDAGTALAGFSSEAVVTVGAMFVLSAAIEASGALRLLPDLLARHVRSRDLFRALLMPVTGMLSAFVNNTAVVAVFIPTVIRFARERGWSPQRFLIPLSYSSQFGGVCTLIGTSTNLLVNALAIQAGLSGFTMFEFAGLGVAMMAVGITYLMLTSRWLLPEKPVVEQEPLFELDDFVTELEVFGEFLAGKSVDSLELPRRLGLVPIDLIRGQRRIWQPGAVPLQVGDVVRVSGAVRDLTAIDRRTGLRLRPIEKVAMAFEGEGNPRIVQAMVPAQSGAIDHTPVEIGLLARYNAVLVAVRRHEAPIHRKLSAVRFQVGDVALLLCTETGAAALQHSRDFVVLREQRHAPVRMRGALVPLTIGLATVTVAALGWLPIYLAALAGCVALVVTRTLAPADAFASVQWRVLFLIAGMLPLGLAMESTGLADAAVAAFLGATGDISPLLALSLLYLAVAILTEFLSNNAAAVLMVPVGLALAAHLGVDAKPFLVAIAFAASSSFTTPVGYQTNTMVYDAGNYRFLDFVRIGLPLNVVFWAFASVLIPVFFPFSQVAAG